MTAIIASESNQAVLETFDEYQLRYEYREGIGGHTWDSWRDRLYVLAPRLFPPAK